MPVPEGLGYLCIVDFSLTLDPRCRELGFEIRRLDVASVAAQGSSSLAPQLRKASSEEAKQASC